MTNREPTPAGAVLVAIDISKTRNEVLIEVPGSPRRRRLIVLNTRTEHDHFVTLLESFETPVIAGFEATGNYHRPLARGRHRAASDFLGGVSANAGGSAQRLGQERSEGCTSHPAHAEDRRFLAFLAQFPMPASIRALSKEDFIDAAWDVVGKKVAKARLLGDIYETARSSIGLPVALDGPAIGMFRMVIAEGRSLIRQRHEIEAKAHAALANNADYQRLRQLPGIGPIHAMTILAEAGDLRRFRHHRQFLKFCGLDLATHQSGQFRGLTKLSKFGNARLRCAFWMAAQVAIRQRDNSFRAKYERYIARDRDNADLKRKALTAIAAKVARTAHAVIKSGSDYRPFIEGPMPSGRTSIRTGREGASATL
jgi:transposase